MGWLAAVICALLSIGFGAAKLLPQSSTAERPLDALLQEIKTKYEIQLATIRATAASESEVATERIAKLDKELARLKAIADTPRSRGGGLPLGKAQSAGQSELVYAIYDEVVYLSKTKTLKVLTWDVNHSVKIELAGSKWTNTYNEKNTKWGIDIDGKPCILQYLERDAINRFKFSLSC